jgi:hypothetical protein
VGDAVVRLGLGIVELRFGGEGLGGRLRNGVGGRTPGGNGRVPASVVWRLNSFGFQATLARL